MTGWRLFWREAALLTGLFAAALWLLGTDEEGLRGLVRFTARVSFGVFLPVYTASSLRRLWPTPATRWLLRNRRYLGVGFAWAHGLHALAIGMLALLLGDAFETSWATAVFGTLAYLLLLGMVATSFDGSARRLGPRRWALLHRSGIHLLWIVFAVQWTGRAIASPAYLPVTGLVFGAGLLRLAAARGRRAARTLASVGAEQPDPMR